MTSFLTAGASRERPMTSFLTALILTGAVGLASLTW